MHPVRMLPRPRLMATAPAFSVASRFLIAVLAVRPAELEDRDHRGVSSPAVPARNIRLAPASAVSPAKALQAVPALVRDLPDSGPALARDRVGLGDRDQVVSDPARLRLPVRHRAHSAQVLPRAVADASSTRRPRKVQ
jgi:hypothetical protein